MCYLEWLAGALLHRGCGRQAVLLQSLSSLRSAGVGGRVEGRCTRVGPRPCWKRSGRLAANLLLYRCKLCTESQGQAPRAPKTLTSSSSPTDLLARRMECTVSATESTDRCDTPLNSRPPIHTPSSSTTEGMEGTWDPVEQWELGLNSRPPLQAASSWAASSCSCGSAPSFGDSRALGPCMGLAGAPFCSCSGDAMLWSCRLAVGRRCALDRVGHPCKKESIDRGSCGNCAALRSMREGASSSPQSSLLIIY